MKGHIDFDWSSVLKDSGHLSSIDRDFKHFFEKIEMHDRYRKQSFAETFPEYWEVLAPYRKTAPGLSGSLPASAAQSEDLAGQLIS